MSKDCNASVLRLGDANQHVHYAVLMPLLQCLEHNICIPTHVTPGYAQTRVHCHNVTENSSPALFLAAVCENCMQLRYRTSGRHRCKLIRYQLKLISHHRPTNNNLKLVPLSNTTCIKHHFYSKNTIVLLLLTPNKSIKKDIHV